jgi:hypothetical protein
MGIAPHSARLRAVVGTELPLPAMSFTRALLRAVGRL